MITIVNNINEQIGFLLIVNRLMSKYNIKNFKIKFEGFSDDGEICYIINEVLFDDISYYNSETAKLEAMELLNEEDNKVLDNLLYTPLWDTSGNDETIEIELEELDRLRIGKII